MLIYKSGRLLTFQGSFALKVFIFSFCTKDTLSTPPATPISISPFFIRPAIEAIVINPLEHCLSIDIPGTDVGRPARIAD